MQKLLAAAASLLFACGDNLHGGSAPDYAAASRDAFCAHAVACGEVADLETCRATPLGHPAHVTASQLAAIADGTIAFDGDAAQVCNDELASRSCDVTSASVRVEPAACAEVFTGTQGDGAACAVGDQCISKVCEVPICGEACCVGACVGDVAPARAKVGESCAVARCEDTAFCDGELCANRKGVGGACIFSDGCQFGLDCGPDGACVALPEAGEPCDGACRDQGTTCSSTTQTCVPVALAGEACMMSSDCSVFYVCDATKRCSPGIALGAACVVGQRCATPGAFCDAPRGESLGTCALLKQLDEPCTGNPSCESQTCDPGTSRCVAEPVCI